MDDWIEAKTGTRDSRSLREYQLEKFRETLRYVKKNSRFYCSHLSDIEPDRIEDLDDIARIPLTTADMLVEDPLAFVCVPTSDIERIVTLQTSGTTGTSKRIFFTKDDQELTIDFFHHGMSTLVCENDKVMIFLPGETAGSVGDLLRRGLERLGCGVVMYGPVKDHKDAARALAASGSTCAVGLPVQMFALSRIEPEIRLKSILLCSDHVPEAVARALKSTWNCEVFEHYGMTETGLGGGVDCSAHDGYHMREADLLFEIIDPASGAPCRCGERGELIFTTLTRRGTPLIRYRTGDMSREIVEPCLCGSALRRFESVSGRISDRIDTGGGAGISMPILDEILFDLPGLTGFSAELVSEAESDALVITVNIPDGVHAAERVVDRILDDGQLGEALAGAGLRIEIRQGGAEVLTYGNTKRRIVDKR